jgi:hypothetical protein
MKLEVHKYFYFASCQSSDTNQYFFTAYTANTTNVDHDIKKIEGNASEFNKNRCNITQAFICFNNLIWCVIQYIHFMLK